MNPKLPNPIGYNHPIIIQKYANEYWERRMISPGRPTLLNFVAPLVWGTGIVGFSFFLLELFRRHSLAVLVTELGIITLHGVFEAYLKLTFWCKPIMRYCEKMYS